MSWRHCSTINIKNSLRSLRFTILVTESLDRERERGREMLFFRKKNLLMRAKDAAYWKPQLVCIPRRKPTVGRARSAIDDPLKIYKVQTGMSVKGALGATDRNVERGAVPYSVLDQSDRSTTSNSGQQLSKRQTHIRRCFNRCPGYTYRAPHYD